MPTRTQKRWSGRLRLGGALFLLLAAVSAADTLIGLASPTSPFSPIGRARPPIWASGGLFLVGIVLFRLGRRWR